MEIKEVMPKRKEKVELLQIPVVAAQGTYGSHVDVLEAFNWNCPEKRSQIHVTNYNNRNGKKSGCSHTLVVHQS